MAKIFITGGLGQIGSHTAELALARGDKVMVIDSLTTGRLEHLSAHPNLQIFIGSIANKELVDGLIGDFKPDALVHTAASYKDPNDWYNDTLTNCVGGSNIINAAKNHKVKRFIYFQTALCYGVKPLSSPITLDHPKFPANSSYAITKTTNEDFLEISGLDFVTFRLANVVGPRNVSGPLPIFYQRLRDKKQCFISKARRDFVYVLDLARVVMQAIDGKGHGAYHFSSGGDIAIQDLFNAVVKAMRINDYQEPELRDLSPEEAPSILLDPSRTFKDFGKINFTPLETTVADAVQYYQQHGIFAEYTHMKNK